jgi:4-hydroxy-2-oxoglutarate aldolase
MSGSAPKPDAPALSGVLPPVPTTFRPEDGGFAEAPFVDNLERWMEHPLAGVLVLGSNGEAPLLTDDECDAVVIAARRAVPRERILLVGTGRQSTAATIGATRRAFEAGADAALVVTPSYFRDRMTPEALRHHYEAVAGEAPGPILLYHVPAFTAVNLAVPTALELASHPRIAGIKDSSGDVTRMERLTAGAPPGFAVLTGNASVLYPSLALGAAGAILAAACVAPATCCDLWRAVGDGDHARARALQARLTPLARAVTSRHGVAGLKALLEHLGWHGGPVRPPLRELSPAERADLAETWSRFEAGEEAP